MRCRSGSVKKMHQKFGNRVVIWCQSQKPWANVPHEPSGKAMTKTKLPSSQMKALFRGDEVLRPLVQTNVQQTRNDSWDPDSARSSGQSDLGDLRGFPKRPIRPMTHPHARAPSAPETISLPNHYFATTTPLHGHYSATTPPLLDHYFTTTGCPTWIRTMTR